MLDYDLISCETPIIPLLIGETSLTVRMANGLLEAGVYAPAIRPPTVPKGSSRIRTTVMATHTKAHLDYALTVLGNVGRKIGVIGCGE